MRGWTGKTTGRSAWIRSKVLVGRRLGREQQIRDLVGQHPVELLGHAPVEAPETGLHVGDAESQLRGRQGARERGVDITNDDQLVRPFGDQHRLEPRHDPSDLRRGAGRPDFQIHLRLGYLQVGEKAPRHFRVVVLACVDQHAVDAAALAERGQDRSSLDEVGARPHDRRELHDASALVRTPASASTCAAGAKRKSARSRQSLFSVSSLLMEWRSRVSRPTAIRGCSRSSSHGWR